MGPKFKREERVWSLVYDCWGIVVNASIIDVLTDPYVVYDIQLEGDHRGAYETGEENLESEAEHAARG